MNRQGKVVPIKRKVLAKEVRMRMERVVCHLTNKVMGSAEPRVEIVGLPEVLYVCEDLFFCQFVSRISGKNAMANGGYRKIPGLAKHDGGPVKWRFNMKAFSDKAENSQRRLLESIFRPNSPIVRRMTAADTLSKLIAAVQMTVPDCPAVLIDEAEFFNQVVKPFARGSNPVSNARKVFGLEKTTRHPVIKWRFDLGACVDNIPTRQLNALCKITGDAWPDLKTLTGADERNRRRAASTRH
ncbi:MAG: hypothetical protein NTW66_01795 [Candidatus Magasanikbacteria bacterium]|nr:hypothetical protein [Candidatus Magasanikbacteria bacterium]